jgi:hypothetical protein
MHHSDQTGTSSTYGIFVERAKGSSSRGATAAADHLVVLLGESARGDANCRAS